MAEKKEEKVKYKFGQKELNLDDYIYNLGTNLQRYMDSKKNWSDGQRQEFVDSYNRYIEGLTKQRDNKTDRFYTDDAGNIYDSTGELSDKDYDTGDLDYYYDDEGNQITTADYDILSKRKQKKYKTFSANREVANYFNWVGRYMDPIKAEEKEKFNLAQHGFVNYWNKLNNKLGGQTDLRPYLEMDQAVDGKRARTNRLRYLSQQLSNYLNQFEDNYDWSDSGYESADAYKASLQALLTQMQDGNWDNNDMMAANQAGVNGDFYNMFFTDKENPELSDEQIKAEKEKKEQEARDAEWQNEVDRAYAVHEQNKGQYYTGNPYTVMLNDYDVDGKFNMTKWVDSFDTSHPYYRDIKINGTHKNYIDKFFENPFVDESRRVIPLLLQDQAMSKQLADGRYYLSNDVNRDKETNTVLIYNPQTGTLERTFIGEVPFLWEEKKNNYAYSKGWGKASSKYYKEGGSIELFQFGGGFDVDEFIRRKLDEELQERANKNGISKERQQADERRIGTVFTDARETAAQNDTEFTSVEYARIGAAIGDITSMIAAWVPGYGTAVSAVSGVGSTLTNAYADFADEGVSGWDATKNFFLNLGMDIVGLIPGGGTASKGAKIAKTLLKTVPKVALALSVKSGIENREEIMGSLKKLSDTPGDLTVGDWQNIAHALSIVSGTSQVAGTALHNKLRANKQQKQAFDGAGTKDKVVVDVTDTDGVKRSVLFEGEDALALRQAREKGGKEGSDEINAILHKYENTKNSNVVQSEKNRLQFKGKWYNPTEWGKWEYGDTGSGKSAVFDLKADTDGVYLDRGAFKADEYIDRMPNLTRLKSDQNVDRVTTNSEAAEKAIAESLKPDFEERSKNIAANRKRIEQYQAQVEQRKSDLGTDSSVKVQEDLDALALREQSPEFATDVRSLRGQEQHLTKLRKTVQQLETQIAQRKAPVAPKKPKLKKNASQAEIDQYNQDLEVFNQQKAQHEAAKKAYKAETKQLEDQLTEAKRVADEYEQKNKLVEKRQDLDISGKRAALEERMVSVKEKERKLDRLNKWLEARQKREATLKKMPQSYLDFIRQNADLDGNISWSVSPNVKSQGITEDAFREILKRRGVPLDKRGGLLRYLQTGGVTRVSYENDDTTTTTGDNIFNFRRYTRLDPTWLFGLPRTLYANRVNKRITDMAIDAERPFMRELPNMPERRLITDWDTESSGFRNAASLSSTARRLQTTDIDKYNAVQLEAAVKGQDFINQAKAQSNKALQLQREQQFLEDKEEAAAINQAINANKENIAKAEFNKSKYAQAEASSEFSNNDRWLQQLEYDRRTKDATTQAYEDSQAETDISEALTHNLGSVAKQYGVNLPQESIDVWNAISSGQKQKSALTETELQAYNQAYDIATQLRSTMFSQYKGIPRSPYFGIRTFAQSKPSNTFTPVGRGIKAKDGTKLKIATLKARTKDADRFQKALKDQADRHQKMLDRLADSIYGFIESSK